MYLLIPVTLLLVAHPLSNGAPETKVWLRKETLENNVEKEPYNVTDKQSVERRAVMDTSQLPTTPPAIDLGAPGPCSVHHCLAETLVNCTGLSLTEVKSFWFPRNTTVIILDKNHLQEVNTASFSHLTKLRVLSLSDNDINHIQENAFMGFDNLEALNLEYNRLKETSYPEGIFDPLFHLKELRLANNKDSLHYPGQLFKLLKNLRVLTIDTADEIACFGAELRNLSSLVLSGDIVRIDETSFENVPNLSDLTITHIISLSNISDNALQPLHQLDVLKLSHLLIGLRQSLHMLKPLVGKNITTIEFDHLFLNSHERYSTLFNNEGIVDSEKTKYLKKICVRYCSITSTNIFVIKTNAFFSSVWNDCLRGLDLSGNPILGTKPALSLLLNFKHIEIVLIDKTRRVCYDKDSFTYEQFKQQSSTSGLVGTLSTYEKSWCTARNDHAGNSEYVEEDISRLQRLISENNILRSTRKNKGQCSSESSDGINTSSQLTVYVSNSLQYLSAAQSMKGSLNNGDRRIRIAGADNLVYFDMRDSLLSVFQFGYDGLDALESLLLSGNDVSVLSETFFDSICHLKELDLSNCHLDANFMCNHSARVFYNLPDLRLLDLSQNLLQSLHPRTFSSNNKLEIIDLSRNRFKNIPFDLQHVPKLTHLNLRENSITTLVPREMNALDHLAQRPGGFELFMTGNILACGCDNIRFLHWLQTTSVHLEDTNHFPCINNEGEPSNLGSFIDLESMWRKCVGRVFFSISLILLCCLVVGFLLVFFVWKNKIFIKSTILQILTGYKLKTPQDYPTGVFIGYAEIDYYFPCFVLCTFIEEELNLTTYIYNRDNIAVHRASSIVDAINNSWRIILVVTDNFLHNDDWAMCTTRTAIYGLSPANPARVVVLVLKNIQHRLPQEVLCAIPEENIIVLSSWTMNSDLRAKLRVLLRE